MKSSFEEDLQSIKHNLELVSYDQRTRSTLLDTLEVDKACQEIGHKILQSHFQSHQKRQINKNLNVYITGEIYLHGGHSREIEDWITNIYSNRENILIISGSIKHSHMEELEKLAAQNIRVIYTDETCLEKRVKWLQNVLVNLNPDVIFVSTTHNDVVVLAALQPELVNKLYWNLSLDNSVSIGLHLTMISKIIVKRPYIYFYLKDLGLSNLSYIPFNRPDFVGDLKQYVSTDPGKKIITASCTSSSHKIEMSYAHKFTTIIPNILKITGGKHIHIGAISKSGLNDLYSNIDALGVSRDKFVVINHVPSLAKALIENDIDILIQTFPVSGGLVSIEAMEAGKMIVNHNNYASYSHNVADFCYRESFSWTTPDELYDFLAKIDRAEIIRQSLLSRASYEKNNKSENLRTIADLEIMAGIDIKDQQEFIKELYRYRIDHYQKHLDWIEMDKKSASNKLKKKSFVRRFSDSLKKMGSSWKKKSEAILT